MEETNEGENDAQLAPLELPQPLSPADESPDDLEMPPPRAFEMLVLAIVCEGGLAVIAWGAGWLCGINPLGTLWFSWMAVAVALVATVPPVIGLRLINRYPIGPLRDLKRVVDRMIVPLFGGLRIWHFAVIAALAGIGEEMLFRGFMQQGIEIFLNARVGPHSGPWIALLVASVVFGLVHPISRMYVFLCVLMGVYLGGLWLVTGNLLVPIIVHGLYDFIALVYLVRGIDDEAVGAG